MILLLATLGCAGGGDGGDSAAGDSGDSGPADTGDTGADSGDSGSGDSGDSGDPCAGATGPVITSPTEGLAVPFAQDVPLTAAWNGSGLVSAAWTLDGTPIADTISGTWNAGTLGAHTLTLTVDATCGPGSDSVGIEVVEPVVERVETYTSVDGVPVAAWYGLSVGPDGIVWGATSSGLVRLDPETRAVTRYTSADGLATDYPRAVLAASDGTVWVGHVGDTTRQGEQIEVDAHGVLTVLRVIDYTESEEITSVFRLREQPYGTHAGDVWMGTNEGLCVWDATYEVFAEHAHPTHPHGNSYGVAFTSDANQWNGDAYQLSRWHYSDDGNLDPTTDLSEFWVPWPVEVEEPVSIVDADVASDSDGGDALWLVSSSMGVARIDVSETPGMSVTELLGDPFPATANAVRGDGDGHVWIGANEGVYIWDPVYATMVSHSTDWLPSATVYQLALDSTTSPPTMWIATVTGLAAVTGLPE